MGYEVEVKYRLANPGQLRRKLVERGAIPRPTIVQEDTYLSHPSRDFAVTNEALRVRRDRDENRITYKGPRRSGPTKTREEIEIGTAAGDDARQDLLRLFEKLGFKSVATIRKSRRPFHLVVDQHPIEIVLDAAEGLGEFAEIEALAATEADLAAVQATVLQVALELGLTEAEPRSYLRMALEARGASVMTPLRPRAVEAPDTDPRVERPL
jgi:adenylate cyclase class 2